MGLDTTHDAWRGSYSTFNEWRRHVAQAAGFPPLKEMYGFGGTRQWEDTEGDDRLIPLLDHSDCDGKLTPAECAEIADALEVIVDKLPYYDEEGPQFKSLWRDKTRSFINGCRDAAAANEPLEFQ